MVGCRLISHLTCPYADRATIAFLEKGQAFERELVDLDDKPDWLRQASPLGRIPLLMVEEKGKPAVFLFESGPICEYIDRATDAPYLFPREPLANALAKGWAEVSSQLLSTLTSYLRSKAASPDPDGLIGKVATLLAGNQYLSGADFGFVDIAFAPLLRRYALLKDVRGEDVLADFPQLTDWSRRVLGRKAVVEAEHADFRSRYVAAYLGD